METRSHVSDFDRVKSSTGFDCCLVMDCSGTGRRKSGGVALLWMSNFDVSLLSCSSNHISVEVTDEWDQKWCLSGVYGFPEEVNKPHTLDLIRNLKSQYQGKWICVGDFNLICDSSEKRGDDLLMWCRWGSSEMFLMSVVFVIWVLVGFLSPGITAEKETRTLRSVWTDV